MMNDSEGSEYDRLFYPFLFEGGKASIEDVLAQVRHSTLEKCREVIELRRATLEHSGERDIVTELLNPPFAGWLPLPAIALTNDIAVVTAVGNDVGFDNVFARQVIAYGRRGDIALGISTSGNSTNVLVALEQAKKQGLLTIGLSGYDGGKMMHSRAVDFCINSPSDHIPRIQEAQATTYHALLEVIHTILERALTDSENRYIKEKGNEHEIC